MIAQDKYGAIHIDLADGSHAIFYPEFSSRAGRYLWSVKDHMKTFPLDGLKEVKGITVIPDPLATLEVGDLVAYRDEEGFVVVVFSFDPEDSVRFANEVEALDYVGEDLESGYHGYAALVFFQEEGYIND